MWTPSSWTKLTQAVLASGATGATVAVLRALMRAPSLTWWGLVGLLASSQLVAQITGFVLHASDVSLPVLIAAVSMCTLIAEHILIGIGRIGQQFGTNPFGSIRIIVAALRGKDLPPDVQDKADELVRREEPPN